MTIPEHLIMPRAPRSRHPYTQIGEVRWPRDALWPHTVVTLEAKLEAMERFAEQYIDRTPSEAVGTVRSP